MHFCPEAELFIARYHARKIRNTPLVRLHNSYRSHCMFQHHGAAIYCVKSHFQSSATLIIQISTGLWHPLTHIICHNAPKLHTRQMLGKSRITVFLSMVRGFGGSKSRLAKAAGAEVAGHRRHEKWHAAARSTFTSQNVQNTSGSKHF